jgi:hypothetical protein
MAGERAQIRKLLLADEDSGASQPCENLGAIFIFRSFMCINDRDPSCYITMTNRATRLSLDSVGHGFGLRNCV